MTIRRHAFYLSLSTLLASPVLAQQAPTAMDMAVRQDLLHRAQEASTTQRHVEALDLAQRAAAITMSPSLRAFIAQEQSALGHFAEALGQANVCLREAEHDPSIPQRPAILSACQRLASELQSRVGHVTVRIERAVDGLVVRIAGAVLNPAFLGVPYIVTPGAITVDATAPGHAPFHQVATVSAGATAEVVVAMEASVTSAATAPRTAAPGNTIGSPFEHASQGSPVGPVVVTGVGALSLGASLVTYILAIGSESSLHMNCTTDSTGHAHCDDTTQNHQLYNDASLRMSIADVTLGVGIAAVAVGVTWWALSSGHHDAERRTMLHVVPRDGGLILGMGGVL